MSAPAKLMKVVQRGMGLEAMVNILPKHLAALQTAHDARNVKVKTLKHEKSYEVLEKQGKTEQSLMIFHLLPTCLVRALSTFAHILIRLSSDLKSDCAADFGKRLMVAFWEIMHRVARISMVFRNHWRSSQYEPSTAYILRK